MINATSFFILGISIFLMLGGMLGAFSKSYRKHIEGRLAEEFPEKKMIFESEQSRKINRQRSLMVLFVGILVFLAWLFLLRSSWLSL